MGEAGAPAPWHSMVMYCVAGAVYLVNAVVLILPGAGFLGDFIYSDATHTSEFIALVTTAITPTIRLLIFIHTQW